MQKKKKIQLTIFNKQAFFIHDRKIIFQTRLIKIVIFTENLLNTRIWLINIIFLKCLKALKKEKQYAVKVKPTYLLKKKKKNTQTITKTFLQTHASWYYFSFLSKCL